MPPFVRAALGIILRPPAKRRQHALMIERELLYKLGSLLGDQPSNSPRAICSLYGVENLDGSLGFLLLARPLPPRLRLAGVSSGGNDIRLVVSPGLIEVYFDHLRTSAMRSISSGPA